MDGALRVHPTPGDPDRFATGMTLKLDGAPVQINSLRWTGGDAIVTLDVVATRDDAERLEGKELQVLASSLPSLDDGEYYHYQLLDLEVWSSEGEHLGVVKDILVTGGNNVLVVGRSEDPGEILIPAIEQVVLKVDLAGRRMTVELWEGMR
ncbi:MAG: 16S rRNA processing protein RimM [Chloroflexi bacterium]|jgi:16S rRNA processing protein RimM|nr:MAG: 16S rRNA processing protein RimM [Chloroflexota bacterium]